ncbi:erythrocyte membrane protein 1, EMP1, exon 2, partial [Plasmodium reichenowi]
KETKSSVDMLRVLEIPKGDYGMPTLKSKNRYIPYKSAQYKGKTYLYVEGDTDEEKYMFMSDTTDVTSSESEYEELDINDIYVPGSPQYKTLIEVVLEPSKRDIKNDIPSSDTPTNKFTDDEWNELKDEFISNMLQSEQNDVPNDYRSGNIPMNTNNTTMSRHNVDEKSFIMSIHDRNLLSGEEYNYDMANSVDIPIGGNHGLYIDKNVSYSGIDLINDSLNSGNHDIYNELLKRKENELFGTNHHPKRTTTNRFAKPSRDDPIHNQLELFHKWLDRHRDMCEKWDKNKKEELLDKLKKEWEQDYNNNSGDIHNRYENVLNTDVSIQINMNDPKPINEFTNMDTTHNKFTMDNILEDLEKYNEPYYDFYEDNKSSVHHNNKDLPTEIHIEIDINNQKVVKEKHPIADMWDI